MNPLERRAAIEGDYNRSDILRLLARLLLSLLFLLSAWLKAEDYPSFEVHLLTHVGTGWTITPFLATMLIAIEFALGLHWMNISSASRWLEQATAALLLFFSAYLGFLWWTQGNNVDCGCMGSALHMSPSEALSRNFVAGALLVLARGQRALLPFYLKPTLVNGLTLALALGATAYTTPPPWDTAPVRINKPINDSPLFRWGFPYPDENSPFPAKLGRNKAENTNKVGVLNNSSGRLTAILSVHCSYCALAADRISKLKQEHPEWNIQVILIGRSYELPTFIQEHNLHSTHTFHPPQAILHDFVPNGVPVIWFTAADGRKWTLTLRQVTPDNIEILMQQARTSIK